MTASCNLSHWMEVLPPGFADKDAHVVSFTPQAASDLTGRGVRYSIPEDFYSFQDLYRDDETYFWDQRAWFKDFDRYLQSSIPAIGQSGFYLAHAHYNPIKYLVDSAVFDARILGFLFDRLKPRKVVFAKRIAAWKDAGARVYGFYEDRPSFYSSLVSRVGQTRGISEISIVGVQGQALKRKGDAWWSRAKRKARRVLDVSRAREPLRGMRVLVLQSGNLSTDLFVAKLRQAGMRIYTEQDFQDFKGPAKRIDKGKSAFARECESSARNLKSSKLLDRWSALAGVELGDLLYPYLERFVRENCAKDLEEIPLWREFFVRNRIQCVLSRSGSGEETARVLSAARGNSRILRACVQHGASAYDEKSWLVSDLEPFEVYFAMDTEAGNYFRHMAREIESPPLILESAHYFKHLSESLRPSDRRGPERILYVTSKKQYDVHNANLRRLTISFYFELQKKLVDVFAAYADREFIFKTVPDQEDRISGAVQEYVRQKGIRNIRFDSRPFVESLRGCDRVLADRPSTAYYEAAAAGFPVFSLRYKDFKVWEPAAQMWGGSLGVYRTIAEAQSHVRRYLEDTPDNYRARAAYTAPGDPAAELEACWNKKNGGILASQGQETRPETAVF